MTICQHTPGPWHRNIKPATQYPTVWSGRNKHVAYVATDYGITPDEVEANICLIAAAPDMLAALRLCLPILERLMPYEHDYEREANQAARTAIARATGREGG